MTCGNSDGGADCLCVKKCTIPQLSSLIDKGSRYPITELGRLPIISDLSARVEAPYEFLCRGRTSPPDLQARPINHVKPSQSNLESNHNLDDNHNLDYYRNSQIRIGSLAEPISLRTRAGFGGRLTYLHCSSQFFVVPTTPLQQ